VRQTAALDSLTPVKISSYLPLYFLDASGFAQVETDKNHVAVRVSQWAETIICFVPWKGNRKHTITD
jgi:hypothetical protein